MLDGWNEFPYCDAPMATLRELRERRGLSQYALAQRAEVDQKTVHFLETGHTRSPRGDTLLALARVLGVTPVAVMRALADTQEAIDDSPAPPRPARGLLHPRTRRGARHHGPADSAPAPRARATAARDHRV